MEIMRDLATYEANFALDASNPRGQAMTSNLTTLEQTLSNAREKLNKKVAFDDEGEAYFTFNNIEEELIDTVSNSE